MYEKSESTEAVPAVLDQDLARTAERYEANGLMICAIYLPPTL